MSAFNINGPFIYIAIDPNYFSKPFDPISVTDGDAKQCLVIPSDQFK